MCTYVLTIMLIHVQSRLICVYTDIMRTQYMYLLHTYVSANNSYMSYTCWFTVWYLTSYTKI